MLNLSREDKIYIATSSGNSYISGCVTKTIEKYCSWTRVREKNIKAALVIHEFGKFCDNDEIEALKNDGVKIIEDYAHAFPVFFQNDTRAKGDYVVFSFPKFFQIHFGGLLLSKNEVNVQTKLKKESVNFIKVCINSFLPDLEQIINSRKARYDYYSKELSRLRCKPYFHYDKCECPSVYLFYIDLNEYLLEKLKSFLQIRGVECSVFYGEKAFFIPCNQRLCFSEIDMIIQLIESYIKGVK
ncbi:DegT/DnrJ/EryC1/StrS family aminotransferase [Escherichia coli]|nr:DegT/DnrJ/EryC1/StrS family aminotransferase [Escherichia coli]EFD0025803.1 hypothetical protein [Escherichia coli]PCO30110.1 hypothetical protein CP993_24265 [Escherichia coli]